MKIQEKKKVHIRWMLVCYDILIYLLSAILLLRLYGGNDRLSNTGILQQMCISMVCIFGIRLLGIYMDRCGDMEAFSAICV